MKADLTSRLSPPNTDYLQNKGLRSSVYVWAAIVLFSQRDKEILKIMSSTFRILSDHIDIRSYEWLDRSRTYNHFLVFLLPARLETLFPFLSAVDGGWVDSTASVSSKALGCMVEILFILG